MQLQKTRIENRHIEGLFYPIAAFLRAEGLSRKAAIRRFSVAFDKAGQIAGARKLERIGQPMPCADAVGLWAHDPRFLDSQGRPRALSMEGPNGLRALIRAVDSGCDPEAVARVLVRFGNVRKSGRGKYRLIQPLFFTSTSKALALEPMATFLSDASATLGRILRRTRRTRGPELFWRKVETAGLSPASARQFVVFVRERGQSFLEELDDWLEARSTKENRRRSNGKPRRVGVGLFSIDSGAV